MATKAEEAIIAHLASRTGVGKTDRVSPSGWVSSTGASGLGADLDTIHFQKTRQFQTCQVHQVAFTNARGIPMELVLRTWREPDGTWVVSPVGGGSPGGPLRQHPWVNFTASFGAFGFVAGGDVEGVGSDQAKVVRMTFADGYVAFDVVDSGIVLFFEPGAMSFPAEVEILDADEVVLASHRAFEEFAS